MTTALIAAANGSGPAPITHAREITRMDRAGEVRLELPGCHPRTSDAQVYADVRLVRYAEEFGTGTINSITRTENNESVDLAVSALNRMGELADIVVKIAAVGTPGTPNVPIAVADAVQAVMAAVPVDWGWTTNTTTYGPSTDTVFLEFSGESVLEALGKIREATGHHFIAEGRTLVWRYKQLTNRGLRAIKKGRDVGVDVCFIDGEIEESESLEGVATRYYFTGSGNGTAKNTSTSGGTWAPPDSNYVFGSEVVSGRTLYYLAYTPTDSIRRREETRTYSNISDPNQLRQSVYEDLRKHIGPRKELRFDVVNVRMPLVPGDIIHVEARTTQGGYRALDIDTDVVVLETTREIDNDDSHRVGLVTSTTDDWIDDATNDVITTLIGKVADLERKDQPVQRANYAATAGSTPTATTATTAPKRVDSGTGQTSVINTTAPTAVASYTIPAGTLGTADRIETVVMAAYTNNTGAAQNITIRLLLGGVTIASDTFNAPSAASAMAYHARIMIGARGSLTSQATIGEFFSTGAQTAGVSAAASVRHSFVGTTLNMANVQTLTVEVVLGVASANLSVAHRHTSTVLWR